MSLAISLLLAPISRRAEHGAARRRAPAVQAGGTWLGLQTIARTGCGGENRGRFAQREWGRCQDLPRFLGV